jgi:formylglycine-generating enzyme required for sulfatase activity
MQKRRSVRPNGPWRGDAPVQVSVDTMSTVDVTGLTNAGSLGVWVTVPEGEYRLGDAGERAVRLGPLSLARYPVTNADFDRFVGETGARVSTALAAKLAAEVLADHPVTDVTYADALAFCGWATSVLDTAVRLPSSDEWEAAARGPESRIWPWGDTFDPERCNCDEAAWGWTVPVDKHPGGASPCGAEQLCGNVWEWVGDPPDEDGWRTLRGGSFLDTSWGVRAARTLPADPRRATPTTGFRIVIDGGEHRAGPP